MGAARSAAEDFASRKDEEYFYSMAAREVASGMISHGLHAKALSETGGDEKAARALYIKLRAQMMESEFAAAKEAEDGLRLELQKQMRHAEWKGMARWAPVFLAILLGALWIYFRAGHGR
ncbi:MAG: hypothetical protein HKL98_06410 [Burkholderiales bacterium]|nr:hypothetical protein [Burkholderiales bacterium]